MAEQLNPLQKEKFIYDLGIAEGRDSWEILHNIHKSKDKVGLKIWGERHDIRRALLEAGAVVPISEGSYFFRVHREWQNPLHRAVVSLKNHYTIK